MGYRFEQATEPQQMGSLTYPEDIRTRLDLRQELNFGRKHFFPDEVQILPNGELIFKNITGDILVNNWLNALTAPYHPLTEQQSGCYKTNTI